MPKRMRKELTINKEAAHAQNAQTAIKMSICSYNKFTQKLNLQVKRPHLTIPSLDGKKLEEKRAPLREVFLQATGGLLTDGQHVDPPK